MAAISLETARERLCLWLEADAAVARNQTYSIGSRSVSRANAGEIRQNIDYWQRMVNRLETGGTGPRVRYGVPES